MPRVPIGTYTTSEAIPEFQARLKRLMREAHLNDRQLGQMLGVDGSAIHHWRAGNSRPSLSRVLILCRILGCDPNYLLGWSEKRPDHTIGKLALQLQETIDALGRPRKVRVRIP